ncbi:MAG: ABC transporter ATP-binding protein [Planctomycetes bacterium]|nr:ABC transporter ATP-binding protein [Planctomycetota bacterium]MCB9899980.1 ABC transporter ATP-binding protein [Planctomycetota bacterium]
MAATTSSGPLRRLWRYTEGHRGAVRRAISWSILKKIFDLAPPFLIGLAVDIVTRPESNVVGAWLGIEDARQQFVVLTAVTVITWVLESWFQYIGDVGWRNLAQTVQHGLRRDAYAHVQDLEMAWFEDESTGGLMAVLNDDVNQLERFLDGGADAVLQTLTTTAVITAVFFALSPQVAWIAMLPVPLVLWGSFRFQKRIAPRYEEVRRQVGNVNHLLANNLGGMATIKSYVRETHEVERLERESEQYREVNRRAIRLSAAFTPLIRMVILVGFTATLVWGGWMAFEGRLSVATFSLMAFLTQRLLWPLTRLGETFDLYQRAMASANRVFALIDRAPRIVGGPERLPTDKVAGRVALEDVTFAYGPGREPVLHDLDLVFEAGKTTAVVGPTGSGKTTLVKLLLRFYDVSSGRVTLDGHDIRELDLGDVRRAIGLVSQDVYLFHGSVRENIAYGRPEATSAEIEAAAQAAEAHAFIESLPQGYDTIVGERGQKLSGGQRQRISLARAVLKDPPILVLDEATSSVDNETEAAIQRSLDRISVGRTTIVIAHRLSTVRNAYRIHALLEGRPVEAGTHEELLEHDGVYAALWRVQTGERAAFDRAR